MKSVFKKLWSYIEGLNGLLFILYSIFVFETSAIVSNHFSIYYFAISMFFITILSVIICPVILRFFSKININNRSIDQLNKTKKSIIVKIALYLIPLFIFLVYYFAYYPGGFSYDSFWQYNQAVNNQYNDWHPVIQTLFAFKLPLTLTRGWIGSIALFQIICFSIVLGYSFNTILKYTNLKYTLISMALVLLNPQLGHIALYPWKDISFAIGALLLLTYSLEIYITNGDWITKPLNTVLFILTAALTTLFRHNALLFTFPLLIAVLFYITKKRGLIICLSIIVACLGIKLPLYSAIGVESPDQRQVETLGFPMTVIGAVVTYTPEALDYETKEFAYKVAPKEVWEENYGYGSYNSVKWDKRTNNEIIEEYGAQKVVSMMFKCMKNSKRVALISLIKLTEASYTVSNQCSYIIRPRVPTNNLNIQQGGNVRTQAILNAYSDFVIDNFSHIFMYLGIMHLLLIISILSKCKLNKWVDWKKIFFILPVFVYNLGTTLLLTGIADATRFFFYTYPLIPILLVFLYYNGKTFKREDYIE